jgi:hypothetical protein
VEDHRKLAGKRDFRPLHATPLGHVHGPALQSRESGGVRVSQSSGQGFQ